ncbi:MAG: ABC transporter permease [Candidatus Riflebacteria bacterium]|nr:ABC transporter permease [Candidatus Riflebacteria bacterium]
MTAEPSMLVAILHAAINAGTPILFAATGEVIVERSGVLNLGLEGMMMIGALSGFAASRALGDPWLGFLAAGGATALFALIHACLAVGLRANQIVSGLALTILGCGLASFLGNALVGEVAPRFETVPVPGLVSIPLVGPILFRHKGPVYLSFALTGLAWFFLYRTRPGLALQVTGDSPETADAAGIDVPLVRTLAVAVGGAMAGMGGAYLSLADTPSWMDKMAAGRGWIAVALVIFAGWDPVLAAFGSYLFGGLVAVQLRIQAFGYSVSPYVLSMLPYVATLAALTASSLRPRLRLVSGAPEALGRPFDREERR